MDNPRQQESPPPRLGILFYLGAGALMIAMIVEGVAVLGRHIGMPLLGALEIIQVCILLMASAAMLSASLNDTHARVHLLTDRLPPGPRRWLLRGTDLLSCLFFVGLAAGSLWLTLDFWNSHEESELLHIPYRPLRVISLLAVVAIAVIFLRDAVRGRRERQRS